MNNGIMSTKKMLSVIHAIEWKYKITFIATWIWGIFAHGMVLFNRYCFHDDTLYLLRGVGSTISSGRWMLEVFHKIESLLFTSQYYNISLINGVWTILLICFINIIIVKCFAIKNIYCCIAIAGITVSFPTIGSLFAFMFTSVSYAIGFLMAVFGAYILCKSARWYIQVTAILLMGCSVGVYQSNISVYTSFILLYLIKNCTENKESMIIFFKKSLHYGIAVILSVVFYFIVNKTVTYLLNITLTDYQGISNMGKTSFWDYYNRVIYAYRMFFLPNTTYQNDVLYPFNTRFIYWLILLSAGILTVTLLVQKYQKVKSGFVQLLILVLILPLCIHLPYLMVKSSDIFTRMLYSHIFLYVYIIWLIEHIDFTIKQKPVLQVIVIIGVFFLSYNYCKKSNINYLAAEVKQQRLISYFSELVADIHETENYKAEYPVVFINEREKNDVSFDCQQYFDNVDQPYQKNLVNDYAWKEFMKIWIGYNPVVLEEDNFKDLAEVKNMPSYPDYGSIKVINETVVVKF